MCDYIIRTDGPMRFDVFLYLRGTNQYTVQELGKHGRFIDVDDAIMKLRKWGDAPIKRNNFEIADLLESIAETDTVLEASYGTDS